MEEDEKSKMLLRSEVNYVNFMDIHQVNGVNFMDIQQKTRRKRTQACKD